MRVLIVGAVDVRSSDATLLLARALEASGSNVTVIPVDADLPAVAAVGRAGEHLRDRAYVAGFNRRLRSTAARFRPDAVLLYGSNWCVLPDTLRHLRRRHGCALALWEVNQRVFWGFQAESIPLYDHVFCLDSYLVPVLAVARARRVHHLPACADPDEHAPVALTDEERQWYGADLCLVGTATAERTELVRRLARYRLHVYGTGWDGVGPELAASVRDEPVYGLKKAKVYGAARLCLNVHQPHMIHGENFRVFEVAACGGVSISTRKPDLVRCLEPGREVVVFDGPDDAAAKVRYYLDHPEDRDELARAGRARVLAEHTYVHRARSILQTLGGDG